MADISRYMKPILDEDGCTCGYFLPIGFVTVEDGECKLIPPDQLFGGGEPPPTVINQTPGSLSVVCDADGNQIFVKCKINESGDTVFVNPASGDEATPMVDFFPCPPSKQLVHAGNYCYEV